MKHSQLHAIYYAEHEKQERRQEAYIIVKGLLDNFYQSRYKMYTTFFEIRIEGRQRLPDAGRNRVRAVSPPD